MKKRYRAPRDESLQMLKIHTFMYFNYVFYRYILPFRFMNYQFYIFNVMYLCTSFYIIFYYWIIYMRVYNLIYIY